MAWEVNVYQHLMANQRKICFENMDDNVWRVMLLFSCIYSHMLSMTNNSLIGRSSIGDLHWKPYFNIDKATLPTAFWRSKSGPRSEFHKLIGLVKWTTTEWFRCRLVRSSQVNSWKFWKNWIQACMFMQTGSGLPCGMKPTIILAISKRINVPMSTQLLTLRVIWIRMCMYTLPWPCHLRSVLLLLAVTVDN